MALISSWWVMDISPLPGTPEPYCGVIRLRNRSHCSTPCRQFSNAVRVELTGSVPLCDIHTS